MVELGILALTVYNIILEHYYNAVPDLMFYLEIMYLTLSSVILTVQALGPYLKEPIHSYIMTYRKNFGIYVATFMLLWNTLILVIIALKELLTIQIPNIESGMAIAYGVICMLFLYIVAQGSWDFYNNFIKKENKNNV